MKAGGDEHRSTRKGKKMNLNGLLIGSENPPRLRDYYTKLFGKPTWDEGGYFGWQLGSGSVTIGPHDQGKGENPEPGGVIWEIEGKDGKGPIQKVKGAGGSVGEGA